MQTNPILVLILSALICIATLLIKFIVFDINGDHGIPEGLSILIIMADTFKDILFVATVLFYLLYGTTTIF